jgi:hypothetical protein
MTPLLTVFTGMMMGYGIVPAPVTPP